MTLSSVANKEPLLNFIELKRIDIKDISPNPHNPREKISKREVSDIRDSIKEMGGVLVPVVVYEKDGKYSLLDGERRWRASKELSKTDPKFRIIPANIIRGPLSRNEIIRVMFNIHMERKQWSTASIAGTIGILFKLNPDLSDKKIAEIIHISPTAVREARQFLRMPKNLRDRCLEGDLDEYYLILLARNLEVCEKNLPDILEKYDWDHLAKAFISKVDSGFVERTKDFNLISKMARESIRYDREDIFATVFRRMVEETAFTPSDAYSEIETALASEIELIFIKNCSSFLRTLRSFFSRMPKKKWDKETEEILRIILDVLKQKLD